MLAPMRLGGLVGGRKDTVSNYQSRCQRPSSCADTLNCIAKWCEEDGALRRSGRRCDWGPSWSMPGGRQLWAERYDFAQERVFAVQDEVTRAVVGVGVSSGRTTQSRLRARTNEPGENPPATSGGFFPFIKRPDRSGF